LRMNETGDGFQRVADARSRAQYLVSLEAIHATVLHSGNRREGTPECQRRGGTDAFFVAHRRIDDYLGAGRDGELDTEPRPFAARSSGQVDATRHADQLILKRAGAYRDQRRLPHYHQDTALGRIAYACLHRCNLRLDARLQRTPFLFAPEQAGNRHQRLFDLLHGVRIDEDDLETQALQGTHRALIAGAGHRDDHVRLLGDDSLDVGRQEGADAIDLGGFRRIVTVDRNADQPIAESEGKNGFRHRGGQ